MPDYTELYLQNHISNLMPSANVTIISDLDVHNRNIFNDNTITSNKYDVIILGHQEYVTQKEYDYLRQFVANGGILILPYSNILYAEIKYNPKDDTVVLVKGHSWEFDGKSATKSIIAERWINETSESLHLTHQTLFGHGEPAQHHLSNGTMQESNITL